MTLIDQGPRSTPSASAASFVDGLLAAVAHSGDILAPLLGRLCTQAVLAA
ncbi:hypothetical protein MTR80_13540 [Alcaligenes aquatilis]|uniref:Uncharacterized protein n=1 Tax=Alcaligenes aquatilis TaxID=323284 RepID=A0ABY4NE65_9BURK|nr:hypothetical protein [Alcaligenes aquatilis]UQN35310.1 hypothetical protein MTR80_13540 [Alcaligenes aquatilis]